MGQKTNPIVQRIGINTSWKSLWYAKKNLSFEYILHDFWIRECVASAFPYGVVQSVRVERVNKHCVVTIFTPKPGIVIGRKGADIDALKKKIMETVGYQVSLDVVDYKKPDCSASLIAESIASQITRRVSYKKAMKKAIQAAMRSGALGVRVLCSGRLGGAEIARSESYKEGRVPLHTLRADIDFSIKTAKTAYGICGVKVWVYNGDVL